MTTRSRFKRQESWRLKRVKENWRRPRGVTSRMRKEKNGWPPLVKVGRGSDSSRRGRHPRELVERHVQNEADLEGLNPTTHIVRLSGRLGEKRRRVLLERAKSLNLHIANPGKEEPRPVSEESRESASVSAQDAVPQDVATNGSATPQESDNESVVQDEAGVPAERVDEEDRES